MTRIRGSGGRVTQARRMVVEKIVERGDHHLTAPDLVDDLREDDPEFHESTVYRVLERLTDLGVLEPVHVQSGPTVFHLMDHGAVHHHLLCSSCGAVAEIEGELLAPLSQQVMAEHGFALRADAPITFLGRCARCREVSAASVAPGESQPMPGAQAIASARITR